jgi:hypothetical protein
MSQMVRSQDDTKLVNEIDVLDHSEGGLHIGRMMYSWTGTYVHATTNDSQDQTNKRFVQASSFLDSTIFGETKLPIFLP